MLKKLDFYQIFLYIYYKDLKMGLRYENLDEITRRYMVEEIEHSIGRHELYRYKEFTDDGWKDYPEVLIKAAKEGDDDFLSVTLYHSNCFRLDSLRESYSIFAEAEFNRIYIRALCRRAIDENKRLQVYMAKPTEETKEDDLKLGQFIKPEQLLMLLRDQESRGTSIEEILGIQLPPNSGISVRLVD
jgi:hypothetical protein